MPLTNPQEVVIFSRTVTLTDAQIKALPTTPVEIVPATEVLNYSGLPSKLPLPLTFSVVLDPSGGAYTNVDTNGVYVLAIGSDWSSDGLQSLVVQMAQLAETVKQVGIANSFNETTTATAIVPLRINAGGLQDNALVIALRNGVLGNLTGGNALNSMKVTVFYAIIDL